MLFRTPHDSTYTYLRQKSTPRTFHSITDVPLDGGYIIAPFCICSDTPITLVEPDEISTHSIRLPQPKPITTKSFHTDEAAERTAYAQAFSHIKTLLNEPSHPVQKVVLSRRLHCTGLSPQESTELFLKACHYRPASYVTLWYTPQTGSWLVATPEPLLEYDHHQWRTVALAGTLPYVEGEEPQWNEKNKEEQAIVARFIEEQLTPLTTEITFSPTFTLTTGNLQHLCTDFSFGLREGTDVRHMISRLHPTPAVCGLPRQEALQAILDNEHGGRRYYAGFSGPLNLQGQTHLYVSLRCMQFSTSEATLYAGGGIMPQSIEQEEWDETMRKLMTMRELLV